VEAAARREREVLALEPAAVAGEQPAYDLDGLAQRGERLARLDAELVEPRPLDEAEVGPTLGGAVERGDLAGDLDRMEREWVERRRAEPDTVAAAISSSGAIAGGKSRSW
jgi:hypothetical protein